MKRLLVHSIELFRALFDLLLPRVCAVCGQSLARNEECLCTGCLVEMPRVRNHTDPDNTTSVLFWGRVPFVRASSLFYYHKSSVFKQCIYKLKYENRVDIAHCLGKELAAELNDCGFFSDIDVLIPLPLHVRRERERGYNQSYEICQGIAKNTSIPITCAVIRHRYTSTQTRKNKDERLKNLQDAFSIPDQSLIAGKHVLLVDDVITTGASIEACCDALLTVPDIKISILSLAVTKNTL